MHIVFAGEKVREHEPAANPEVTQTENTEQVRVLSLKPLVEMKLARHCTQDRMHLRDLIDVGLLDATWLDRLPPALAARLRQLLDDPNG